MTDSPRYTSLHDYLRVLGEQKLVIVLIALVAGGAALLMSLRQEPVYEATSAIAFEDEAQQLGALGGGSVSPNVPTGKTPQARAQTIDKPEVLRRLDRRLPKPVTVADLRGAIATSLNEESFLVNVTARWDDPEFSARLANEFAHEAARHTNRQARAEWRSSTDDVQARLEGLGTGLIDQAERAALSGQLTRLRFLAQNARPASVVDTARPPSGAISPQTVRNTVLGVLLGLAVGILVAFLRDTLDRRLRGSRQVRDELDLPLLGRVSEEAMGRVIRPSDASEERLHSDVEALRIVRHNLEFLSAADRPSRTVVVTSALANEGKSTVAAALAFASAAAGKRTLLLDCDLRAPDLARRLGVARAPGLTDFLVGRAEPEQVTQPVALDPAQRLNGNGAAPTAAAVAETLPVVFVASGTVSPQPAELLGSDRFGTFLAEVGEVYDAVIVDSSPLLPVADTLKLLGHSDAVLLCVRSGQTTREQAELAKAALQHVPHGHSIGLVVTGLQRRDEPDFGYYSRAYVSGAGVDEKAAV